LSPNCCGGADGWLLGVEPGPPEDCGVGTPPGSRRAGLPSRVERARPSWPRRSRTSETSSSREHGRLRPWHTIDERGVVPTAILDRLRLASTNSFEGRCLFLSPHLDDAVLSCGALMRLLAPRCAITVVTVFTACGPGPHTHAARSFLRQCSIPDADALFGARRAEDREVLDGLGVGHEHLGLPDALFRRRRAAVPGASLIGRLLPELVHRYPTYRFDIAKGRVSRGDAELIADLETRIAERAADADLVFCPLGVGRHVDHLIVRALGAAHSDRVVYYSDFPYDQWSSPDAAFVARHGLRSWTLADGVDGKQALIRAYGTQADALFPTGRIPAAPETYFAPAS
jgi:LmbE family N-acetylglucosaminyl deacetylase